MSGISRTGRKRVQYTITQYTKPETAARRIREDYDYLLPSSSREEEDFEPEEILEIVENAVITEEYDYLLATSPRGELGFELKEILETEEYDIRRLSRTLAN